LALKPFLIDTGPLVAYLDQADSEHEPVAAWLGEFRGLLCTTSAVITEAMHLIKSDVSGPRHLAELVQAARIQVFESTQPEQLLSAASLIQRYSNASMNFADATLVLLAEHLASTQIVTLDRRGFRIFRTRKGKSFEIFPR
jgi:uncharacterized protein